MHDYRKKISDYFDQKSQNHIQEQALKPVLNPAPNPAPNFANERNKERKKSAAILFGIIESEEPYILLTRRADHLSSHPGQVAFPGGYWEPEDKNLIDTALREAREEVGLDPLMVQVAGALDMQSTSQLQPIMPIMGFINKDAGFRACADEVAEIFSVPLSFLMTLDNYQFEQRRWNGKVWDYYAANWEGKTIWGATANILRFAAIHVFGAQK